MSQNILLISKYNFIIFLLVSFFVLQSLYMITLYNVNFPYAYDITSMNYLVGSLIPGESFKGEILPGEDSLTNIFFHELFADTNSRGIIFPKLTVLPNYILNNFDSSNLFYFSWIVLSLTLFMFFLIIRRINEKLYWILVPISAILFSPLVNSNYWNYSTLIWTLPALGIVSSVYLLNKKQNFKNITGIILLSIFVTYSIPTALTIWLVGSFTIIRKIFQKKISPYKIPIVYFLSMLIIGICYYIINTLDGGLLTQSTISIGEFVTIDSFFVIMTLLAVPFKLNSTSLGIGNIFYIIIGSASLFLAIGLVYYLGVIRKKFDEILPWVLFLIISLSGAILIRIGRFDPYFTGEFAYYSPIIGLFQIGIVALVMITILDIRQQKIIKRKELILYFLYSIIILQMILLVPSYYVGWWKADYYYNEKMDYLQCFSIYHDWISCKELYVDLRLNDDKVANNFIILNFLLKNNFNIFSDHNFNKETILELEEFYEEYSAEKSIRTIDGQISSINGIKATNDDKISINDDVIIISGQIMINVVDDIEVVYLVANEVPIAKFDNFYLVEKNQTDLENEIIWNFAILENYLPDGCKEISVVGIMNNLPFALDNHVELCTK